MGNTFILGKPSVRGETCTVGETPVMGETSIMGEPPSWGNLQKGNLQSLHVYVLTRAYVRTHARVWAHAGVCLSMHVPTRVSVPVCTDAFRQAGAHAHAARCPHVCARVHAPVCTRVCARPLCSHSPPTPGPCLLGVPCPRGQGTLCHRCPGTRLGAPPALPLLGCGPEFAINGSAARAARPAAAGLRQSRRPRGCCRLEGGAEDGPAHHTAWNTRVHTCAGPCG